MAENPSMDEGVAPQRLPNHMNQPVFPPEGFPGPQGIDWEALQVWVEEMVAYKVNEAFQTLQLQGQPEVIRSASSPKEKTVEASTGDGPDKALSIDLGEHPSSSPQEKTVTIQILGSYQRKTYRDPVCTHQNYHQSSNREPHSKNVWESSATSPPEQEMPPGILLPL